jgi:hypothetical protein
MLFRVNAENGLTSDRELDVTFCEWRFSTLTVPTSL